MGVLYCGLLYEFLRLTRFERSRETTLRCGEVKFMVWDDGSVVLRCGGEVVCEV